MERREKKSKHDKTIITNPGYFVWKFQYARRKRKVANEKVAICVDVVMFDHIDVVMFEHSL